MSTTTSGAPNEETLDCIQKWEEDLRKTNNALVKQLAILGDKQRAYNNAQTWENKLKIYWEKIYKSDEIGDSIKQELDLFCEKLSVVCTNTECIEEALEILYCLIQDFFSCTDTLKQKLSELKREIECLNDPELNPKKSIVVKCLEELCAKIDQAIACQKDLLKLMIEILKCASDLYQKLCGDESVGTEEGETCSVDTLIQNMKKLFEGTLQPSSNTDCATESCSAVIEPKTMMPIDCDPYYTKTKTEHEKSVTEKKTAKSEYDEARKKYNGLLSIKTSLVEALDAARAAKDCK